MTFFRGLERRKHPLNSIQISGIYFYDKMLRKCFLFKKTGKKENGHEYAKVFIFLGKKESFKKVEEKKEGNSP